MKSKLHALMEEAAELQERYEQLEAELHETRQEVKFLCADLAELEAEAIRLRAQLAAERDARKEKDDD